MSMNYPITKVSLLPILRAVNEYYIYKLFPTFYGFRPDYRNKKPNN